LFVIISDEISHASISAYKIVLIIFSFRIGLGRWSYLFSPFVRIVKSFDIHTDVVSYSNYGFGEIDTEDNVKKRNCRRTHVCRWRIDGIARLGRTVLKLGRTCRISASSIVSPHTRGAIVVDHVERNELLFSATVANAP